MRGTEQRIESGGVSTGLRSSPAARPDANLTAIAASPVQHAPTYLTAWLAHAGLLARVVRHPQNEFVH